MAHPMHLEVFKQGVTAWNAWRKKHSWLFVDLSAESFQDAKLEGIDLSGANLTDTNFYGADLSNASFSYITLPIPFEELKETMCPYDLEWAPPVPPRSLFTSLRNSNLSNVNLKGASFDGTDLSNANLLGASLENTNLHDCIFEKTLFIATNLKGAANLNTCRFWGPCFIDFNTIAQSGNLTKGFLQGCGLNDHLIDYISSLASRPTDFQMPSCFISHSSKDVAFAGKLFTALQSKGVRCWYAPEHLKTGDRIRNRIDETIRAYDKLLLVLSEGSINSQWVEQEVETALEKERQNSVTVLFPIRVDNTIFDKLAGWASLIKNTRNIGNFEGWEDNKKFDKSLDRLLEDLKPEIMKEHS